jgi:membrane protein required for colicin V production
MHWLDITLLALLAVGAGLGFWSGLLMQVARLVSFGLAIYATFVLNEPVAQLLHDRVSPETHVNLLRGISYVAVFLVVYVTLFALSRMLYKVVRASKLEVLDRIAGAALGAFKMVLVLAPVCAFLAFLALPATEDWMRRSTIAPLLATGLHRAIEYVPESAKNQAQESVEHVRDRLQHHAAGQAVDLLKIEEALRK